MGRNRPLRIRRPRLRFDAGERVGGKVVLAATPTTVIGRHIELSKITNRNNHLWRSLDHKRVLFVQHPLEKGRSRPARSGSFVACAEVLGNCDDATEGGIPRSSRFRWFA